MFNSKEVPMKKELIRGSVETVILRLLGEQAMYGYEMIKTVNERTNGYFEWKEGSLYPCLHRLESEGLVVSEWRGFGGKLRKYYSLTAKGAVAAREQTAEARAFCRALGSLLADSPA